MLTLNPLFSDHAVLQCGMAIPVWGTSSPDTRVEIRLNGATAWCDVSPGGFFLLRLPAFQAGGPYILEAENRITGEIVRIVDVMIGEVWLASGQSNMEFPVAQNRPGKKAGSPRVRMLTVPRTYVTGGHVPLDAEWGSADDPVRFAEFSAAAYFFAEELAGKRDITVGILHASAGGSDALSWTSREGLAEIPELASAVRDYEAMAYRSDSARLIDAASAGTEKPWLRDYFRRHPLPSGEDMPDWHDPDYDDSGWAAASLPAAWNRFDADVNGIYRFRKEIILPPEWKGRTLLLSLGAVDKHDITWFNGIEVGRTGGGLVEKYWNVVRRYEIPAASVRAGRCVISVRACSFLNDGGLIGPAAAMFLTDGNSRIRIDGQWKYRQEFNMGKIAVPADLSARENASEEDESPYLLPYHTPYLLFDNMIAPLIPYAIRGVIWFQGEHNTSHRPNGYDRLMIALIQDWRRRWGNAAMPFHQVSLAGYGPALDYQDKSRWTRIRIQQERAAAAVGSSCVPAYDIGAADNIHFPDKRPVGERLAAAVLAEDYGDGEDARSPRLIRAAVAGGIIELTFSHAAGLRADAGATLFRVAGAAGIFRPASFQITDNRIELENPVPEPPCLIRYAWADHPAGAVIRNRAGLPAAPFEEKIEFGGLPLC